MIIQKMRAWDLFYFSLRLINGIQKDDVLDNWEKALDFANEYLKDEKLKNMSFLKYMRREFVPVRDILNEYRKLRQVKKQMIEIRNQNDLIIEKR